MTVHQGGRMEGVRRGVPWMLGVLFFFLYWFGWSPWLDDWDSINFLLAFEQYSLVLKQPHPPGFPVFIFMAKAAGLVTGGDPVQAFRLVNALGGALGVAFTAAWISILSRAAIGLVSACILGLVPVYLLTSVTILSDPAAFAFAAAGGWAVTRARQGGGARCWLICGILLGLAAGVRLHTLFFLLPLLVAAWLTRSVRGGRRGAWYAGMGIVVSVLAWLVPVICLHDTEPLARVVEQQHSWRYGHPANSILGVEDAGGWYYLDRVMKFVRYFLNLGLGIRAPFLHDRVSTAAVVLVVSGWCWGAWFFRRRLRRLAWLVPGFVVYGGMLYVYLPPYNPRYMLYFALVQAVLLGAMLVTRRRGAWSGRLVAAVTLAFLFFQSAALHRELVTVPPPAQSAARRMLELDPDGVLLAPSLAGRHAEYVAGRPVMREMTQEQLETALSSGQAVFADQVGPVYPGFRYEEAGAWNRDIRACSKSSYVRLYRVLPEVPEP